MNNSPFFQFWRAAAARAASVFRRRTANQVLDATAKAREAERLDRIRQPWKYPADQD